MNRRQFLATTATTAAVSISGCAYLAESIPTSESEPREVSISGEVGPPVRDVSARTPGHGWYILEFTVEEHDSETYIELDHTDSALQNYDEELDAGETYQEIAVEVTGPFRARVGQNGGPETSFRLEIEKEPSSFPGL